MDPNKQPGIIFENIILEELDFKRNPTLNDKKQNNISFSVGIGLSDDEENLSIKMECSINEKDDGSNFYIKCIMIGFFTQHEKNTNMKLTEFARFNGLAMMIPYIREAISNITVKAGLDPVILPPINVTAISRKTDSSLTEK